MNKEEEVLQKIKGANKIAVLTHESPDGDAIGSALAMYLVLKQLKLDVDIIIKEYPHIFNVLSKIDEIESSSTQDYDMAIVLDCASELRVEQQEILKKAKITVNIDHHATNTNFATYNIVDMGGPACSLLLAKIFRIWNDNIDKYIGESLVTGIITDTSGFKYNNIPDTYEFIADMLRLGVDVSEIYRKTLNTTTMAQFELKKIAQERLEFFANGKIAFTYIDSTDDDRFGTKTGDHEGIVDIGKSIEGVLVSIFYRKTDDKWRVSLRSNDSFDVSTIALLFGGGGHTNASGFTTLKSLEDSKKELLENIMQRM